jgi:hypothetical protein
MRVINRIVTEVVDSVTGKIVEKSVVNTYKKPQITKRYCMISMDNMWIARIKPMDLYLLCALVDYENTIKYTITVSKTVKDEIKSKIKISDAQIAKSINSMIANDVIKRIERGVYIVNPECMWSGSVKTQEERIDKYMSV